MPSLLETAEAQIRLSESVTYLLGAVDMAQALAENAVPAVFAVQMAERLVYLAKNIHPVRPEDVDRKERLDKKLAYIVDSTRDRANDPPKDGAYKDASTFLWGVLCGNHHNMLTFLELWIEDIQISET